MDSGNAYIFTGDLAPAEQVNLSTGTITYLVTDSLGSVRGTVNNSGSLTGTCGYDAWGNPETAGGLVAITPFGFAGGYTDPTGLLYLLNRYYDPRTGQFISVDPALSQTLAPYGYAQGNPVNVTDPTGLGNCWKSGFAHMKSYRRHWTFGIGIPGCVLLATGLSLKEALRYLDKFLYWVIGRGGVIARLAELIGAALEGEVVADVVAAITAAFVTLAAAYLVGCVLNPWASASDGLRITATVDHTKHNIPYFEYQTWGCY
jgi:RHS repeat-associated protein